MGGVRGRSKADDDCVDRSRLIGVRSMRRLTISRSCRTRPRKLRKPIMRVRNDDDSGNGLENTWRGRGVVSMLKKLVDVNFTVSELYRVACSVLAPESISMNLYLQIVQPYSTGGVLGQAWHVSP